VLIVIEAAAEEDISRILEIEHEAFSPPWTHGALLGIGDESERIKHVRILGFIILRCMGDEGELLQIAVDKAARRRGVADALMGAALRFAGECSIGSVFLEVRKSNEAALRLYEKHGFRPVRLRKDYYSSPVEDAVVMARSMDRHAAFACSL
jgi:ribosomal-protein-alanine N-acetyltransferase